MSGERKHSPVGASGAHRWVPCPGSVGLAAKQPRSASGQASIDGTFIHNISAQCLEENRDAFEFLGDTYEAEGLTSTCDEAVVMRVQGYIDHIRKLRAENPPVQTWIETMMDFPGLHPDAFSSLDYAHLADGTLTLIDLKSGMKHVAAEGNLQLAYYALMVIANMGTSAGEVAQVTMGIYQCPPNSEGTYSSWTVPAEELIDTYLPLLRNAAQAATSPNPAFTAGGHCCYCPAKAACPTYTQHVIETSGFEMLEEKVSFPSLNDLTDDKLSSILNAEAEVKLFFDTLREMAHNRLVQGKILPGWKLRPGRAARQWSVPDDEIAKAFEGKVDVFTKKIMSPAQLEKLIGKKAVAEYTVRIEGSLTLTKDASETPDAVNHHGFDLLT